MTSPHVLTDDEVASAILKVIRTAKKEVVLVTPYLDLWGHADAALELCVKRGVIPKVYVRDGKDIADHEDVIWLLENGIEVSVVDSLHAKIYLNEDIVVVTSMNMTDYSTKNSLEIAFVLTDREASQRVRDYVSNRIATLAEPLNLQMQSHSSAPRGTGSARSRQAVAGVCIRCSTAIPLDTERPLCNRCYASWAEWAILRPPYSLRHR